MIEKTNHSGNNHNGDRIAYLIDAYLRQAITAEEHDELDDWVGSSDENMRIFEEQTGNTSNDPVKEERNKKYSSIWHLSYYRPWRYSI